MSSKAKFTCKYGTTDFLTARNYHTWKHDIMDFLASDDALEITLGTEEAPHGNATALARDYRKRSGRAFGMIRSSTDPEVRLFVNSLEHRDPARLWVALREKYDTSLSQAGRISILERFHTSTMKPDTSVSVYISTLKSMRQELAGSEEEITERVLLARLLSTLPDSFANKVSILKHKPLAEQTLDTIETWLVEHEASVALRKAQVGSNTNSASTLTTGNALAATTSSRYSNCQHSGGRWKRSKHGGSTSRFEPYPKRQAESDLKCSTT